MEKVNSSYVDENYPGYLQAFQTNAGYELRIRSQSRSKISLYSVRVAPVVYMTVIIT